MNILDEFVNDVRKPEVVIPSPAVIVPNPGAAIARFLSDPAGLKASALSLLDIKVKPVETLETASGLADKVAQAETLLKNIEARRKQHVEPLNKEVKDINSECHRWADPVEDWIKRAKGVLLAFRTMELDRQRRAEEERQKAIREAAERQQEAEAKGDTAQAEAASLEIMRAEAETVSAPLKGFKTDAGTTSVRKAWKVEVVNESEVPDAYLVPDLKKLQAAVNAGTRQIPGCNIWLDESLAVRTR